MRERAISNSAARRLGLVGRCAALLLAAATAFAPPRAAAARPACCVDVPRSDRVRQEVRVLLITGEGNRRPGHPFGDWSHTFYPDTIADRLAPVARVTVAPELSVLTPAMLARYDVVINNSLFLEPTPAQFDALFDFVSRGGGFLSMHAGMVSFLNDERYLTMLGGRFINHAPERAFQVDAHDEWYGWRAAGSPTHPVTEAVSDFRVVDELYVAETNTADLTVVARAEWHPIMWVRRWGEGRVVVLTLGHGLPSIRSDGFVALLRNGVLWAARRDAALPRARAARPTTDGGPARRGRRQE